MTHDLDTEERYRPDPAWATEQEFWASQGFVLESVLRSGMGPEAAQQQRMVEEALDKMTNVQRRYGWLLRWLP